MSTTTSSNDESLQNKNDRNLEIFSIIWFDTHDNISDVQYAEQHLRSIINRFKRFDDTKECQQYIEQKPKHDRLVLIVNHQFGQELIPLIHKFRQVSSIYIYDKNDANNHSWKNNFTKVKYHTDHGFSSFPRYVDTSCY